MHVIFGFCRIFSASKLKCFLSSTALFNSLFNSSITFIVFYNVFGCSLKSIHSTLADKLCTFNGELIFILLARYCESREHDMM